MRRDFLNWSCVVFFFCVGCEPSVSQSTLGEYKSVRQAVGENIEVKHHLSYQLFMGTASKDAQAAEGASVLGVSDPERIAGLQKILTDYPSQKYPSLFLVEMAQLYGKLPLIAIMIADDHVRIFWLRRSHNSVVSQGTKTFASQSHEYVLLVDFVKLGKDLLLSCRPYERFDGGHVPTVFFSWKGNSHPYFFERAIYGFPLTPLSLETMDRLSALEPQAAETTFYRKLRPFAVTLQEICKLVSE